MSCSKKEVVDRILRGRPSIAKKSAEAFAPANIALCKYWGKRDPVLNLPVTSSLSISLNGKGSYVQLTIGEGLTDSISLNDEILPADSPFARRVVEYLDLFRPSPEIRFHLNTRNNIATAAGVASSAAGFAALVRALNALFEWNLNGRELSILARIGSGSACRSVYQGFVEWHAGTRTDGMDSFAEPLNAVWPELRIGLVMVSAAPKETGSRAGMQLTQETSALYAAWPAKVAQDLNSLKRAIETRDFDLLGRTAESNALAMHATMMAAWPPLIYWLPETVRVVHRARELRKTGLPVYLTMDAGPNVKILFLEKDQNAIIDAFPQTEIICPFDETGS